MARARPPHLRSVQTPEALDALRAWTDALPPRTRELGDAAFADQRVTRVWNKADHYVEATVADEEPRAVTLFLTLGRWTSRCNCGRGSGCEHACAAAFAWLAAVEAGVPAPTVEPPPMPAELSRPTLAPQPAAIPTPAPPLTKAAFRAHWSPLLAKKIGRALTEAEDNQLENLAALFADFTQAHGALYPGTLLRHGFDYTPPRGAPLYAPAFAGWWDPAAPPSDPWQLWQYLAYHAELDGREIPEAFQPVTDIAAIRTQIEAHQLQADLATWHHALAVGDESPAAAERTHPGTTDLAGLRACIRPDGGLVIETRPAADKPWRSPPQKWFALLAGARPVDFEHLTPPEAALGLALAAEAAAGMPAPTARQPLPAEATANLFRTRTARDAIVMPDGTPLRIEPEPLALEARLSTTATDRLELRLVTPDGRDATRARVVTLRPRPLYVFENRVWRGPPPTPDKPLPTAALADPKIMPRLRAAGLRLPRELESHIRRIWLRPLLKCWLTPTPGDDATMQFHAQLSARADDPPIEQQFTKAGWQWTARGAPPPRRPEEPLYEFDLAAAHAASAALGHFDLLWHDWESAWGCEVGDEFPDAFIAWHAQLPPDLKVDAAPGLASLLGPALQGHIEFSAAPVEAAGRDWFNLSVKLRVADTTLTPDEIALLAKARGKWVRLARHGWQRLELQQNDADAALNRLGLDSGDVIADGRTHTHRVHALQLAAEADALEARDAHLAAALRERARTIATQPRPPVPSGLRATLRPYQQEGYHFLCHLAALGLGGVLADDMGLGKTVQTLAWLLHLADSRPADAPPVRILVVCPKSVTHGWLTETERFAPALHATAFDPLRLGLSTFNSQRSTPAQLVVANYTQLRLNATWFKATAWDAVILDEGQFIKNPQSQVATVARALPARHRLVLTGTPIENRLTDLWSLFAFAQPGLLGTQPSFRRNYNEANPAAHERLHRRVRHFLLRRTKAQAAPDLPSRTEDDLVVELEGEQRKLYDAELKRARGHLLGIQDNSALAPVRFNVLNSLLRLRQICCHPALVDPAHRDLPSAKLEALLERLEELRDEGHQVLVFSQFVTMLELIRERLTAANIGHLMLTGQTENRAELVDEFQTDPTKTVFLLSLKAAGFGLNLTAASYVILYDPWWNPAAEAQAIDRTHRIGQTENVVAYRLLAEGTVEEKIRALQKEKSGLADAVIQEESLASVLDLDSLKRILG